MITLLLPLAQAGAVKLRTADGVKLYALAHVEEGSTRGVLFAHQLQRSSKDWAKLSERLGGVGFTSIAPDLRGHGQSDKTGTTLTDADYPAMVEDLKAGLSWLRQQGVTEIACVGASIGANLCAAVAADDPGVLNLVLLSPGLNYKGITSGGALQKYGKRPVLLVASTDDRNSKRSASLLQQVAQGEVEYELLTNAGHGTQMLSQSAALAPRITTWLLKSYSLVDKDLERTGPLSPEINEPIKSTGKKLQVHQ